MIKGDRKRGTKDQLLLFPFVLKFSHNKSNIFSSPEPKAHW